MQRLVFCVLYSASQSEACPTGYLRIPGGLIVLKGFKRMQLRNF